MSSAGCRAALRQVAGFAHANFHDCFYVDCICHPTWPMSLLDALPEHITDGGAFIADINCLLAGAQVLDDPEQATLLGEIYDEQEVSFTALPAEAEPGIQSLRGQPDAKQRKRE